MFVYFWQFDFQISFSGYFQNATGVFYLEISLCKLLCSLNILRRRSHNSTVLRIAETEK